MRGDGSCRSCGAPIRWAKSYTTGKRLPLDILPTTDGNLGVVEWAEHERGKGWAMPLVAVNPTDGSAQTPYRYTSHFATCPQAEQWRKQR